MTATRSQALVVTNTQLSASTLLLLLLLLLLWFGFSQEEKKKRRKEEKKKRRKEEESSVEWVSVRYGCGWSLLDGISILFLIL